MDSDLCNYQLSVLWFDGVSIAVQYAYRNKHFLDITLFLLQKRKNGIVIKLFQSLLKTHSQIFPNCISPTFSAYLLSNQYGLEPE